VSEWTFKKLNVIKVIAFRATFKHGIVRARREQSDSSALEVTVGEKIAVLQQT